MLALLLTLLCLAPPAGPAPDADALQDSSEAVESATDDAVSSDPVDAAAVDDGAPDASANTGVRPFEMATSGDELDADAGVPPPSVTESTRVRPDRPVRWRLDVQLEGVVQDIGHGSFRAYSPNDNLLGMGAGMRVDFRLASSPVFLGGGAAYRRHGSSRSIYDFSVEQNLAIQEVLVFLRLSVRALDGIDVYFEPGGGPTIVDLETWSSRRAEQRAVTGMFNGLAGVALYLPKAWLPKKGAARVTGGFDMGLGYGWRAPITVQPIPDTDEDPLATSSARFGDLALRGFIFRTGFFVRFM